MTKARPSRAFVLNLFPLCKKGPVRAPQISMPPVQAMAVDTTIIPHNGNVHGAANAAHEMRLAWAMGPGRPNHIPLQVLEVAYAPDQGVSQSSFS